MKDATRSNKTNGSVINTASAPVAGAPTSISPATVGGNSSATASPLTSRAKAQDGMTDMSSVTVGEHFNFYNWLP